jgi:hypothetical protein
MVSVYQKFWKKQDIYLSDANHVIKEGIFVPELNAYAKFIGRATDKKFIDPKANISKSIKYAIVGLDRKTGKITTFHVKELQDFIKNTPSLGIKFLKK